jgi:parallel beta-helix repeat protein
VAATLVVVLAAVGGGAGATWDMYPGESIQDTINASYPGDTIYVHAGEYCENVDVNKRLTLIGDGADVVTVRAADAEDHVFEVTGTWVNISGFTTTGAHGAGIYLTGTDHCNISENNASGNDRYGIRLHDSSNNMLVNNDANSNGDSGYIGNFGYGYGIYLYSSSNNMLANNTASNNRLGTYLSSSSNNTLHDNMMSGNRYNFGVHGNSLSHYTQVIDTSNTVDGGSIYYWVCQQDKIITGDAGFVGVVNSTNITIKGVILLRMYNLELLCQ